MKQRELLSLLGIEPRIFIMQPGRYNDLTTRHKIFLIFVNEINKCLYRKTAIDNRPIPVRTAKYR